MIHFNQRNVLKGNSYRFATWLNELAAEGMTDIVGSRLGGYTDSRYPGWLSKPGFNCDITNWDSNLSSTCFSYNIVGSYGGFLLRHYGLNYYKALFNNSVTNANSSMDILAHAISAAGGDRLQTFRHWGASIAMLPATGSPDGFGYPARSEGGFSLPAYNGATFLSRRTLPSAPANLVPYGHHPVVKSGVSGTYTNTITVPANTHLSVVIQ